MRVYKYTPGKRIPEKHTAIALGFFDGVHAAHRALLERTRHLADEHSLVFSVFTFSSENSFKSGGTLYSTEEKLEIFEKLGVEAVIVADFSDVSSIGGDEFIKQSLLLDMGCRAAVAGYDFRFGKDRSGDASLLCKRLTECGALCEIESEYKIDGEKVSTTKIKELLLSGNAREARRFLGAPYFIKGRVARGNGVGRLLGFPTVNIGFKENASPLRHGVYHTALMIDGRLFNGITNVGVCPTFEERAPHTETFIIDFDGDLYDEEIQLFFLDYIREEKKFSNEKELILQINVDKNKIIKENGELLWQEIGLS